MALACRVRDGRTLDDTYVILGAPMTFGGAIVHVVLHNAEHRTKALHVLQRLGLTGVPEVDHAL